MTYMFSFVILTYFLLFQESRKFVIENGILRSEKEDFDVKDVNLGNWFLETFKKDPDFVGQVDSVTGEECTYRKMAHESIRCAIWLRKHGIKPGDIVITYTHNHMLTYIPILAAFYNGAAHIFGSYGYYPEMVRTQLKSLKPKFIFMVESEVGIILKILKEEKMDSKVVVFTEIPGLDSLQDILEQSEPKEIDDFQSLEPPSLEDKCLLLFSSGSTGDPKIIVLSYETTLMTLLMFIQQKELYETVTLYYVPLYWSNAHKMLLVDILTFTKRIIVRETACDPEEAFKLIEKYKVTNVRFSLNMIYRMYQAKEFPKYDTSSVRIVRTGGVKLQPGLLKFMMGMAPNGGLYQTYGTSEIGTYICAGTMNNIDLTSTGYLWPNTSMKVMDPHTGKILGPKEKGEICLKTPYLLQGYLNDQEEMGRVFDSEGWYHTGDIGYYDETGLVYVLGRVKNSLVDEKGEIVPLWDLRRSLLLNTDVIEAVVIPDSETSDSLHIFVFVLLSPGSRVTKNELSELANNLSNISIPITVEIVDHLPLTTNGKVKLGEMKKLIHAMKITP